jgi:hypothetical protein
MTINQAFMDSVATLLTDTEWTFYGKTVTESDWTLHLLAYAIGNGLKSAIGDVESVSRAAIMGKGSTPWKEERRIREAKALGLDTYDGSESAMEVLADKCIAKAIDDKLAKAASGELTVGDATSRGDAVWSRMMMLVGNALNAKREKDGKKKLVGKDLSAAARDKLSDADFAAKIRAKAKAAIADEAALLAD